MRGTFAKFGVLTLVQHRRIILLDSDTVVVRNIDHLSGVPGHIAGYFHFDSGHPCPLPTDFINWNWTTVGACASGMLNSGVLVLRPDLARFGAAQRLVSDDDPANTTQGKVSLLDAIDGGKWESSDQRLWHALYDRVTELPFGYNVNVSEEPCVQFCSVRSILCRINSWASFPLLVT